MSNLLPAFEMMRRSTSDAAEQRSPAFFFVLVFGLTLPFWAVSAMTTIELLPGVPVAAFAVVCPAIAALALSYRAGGVGAMTTLAKRAFAFKRIGSFLWYAPILLINPLISILSFAIMRLTGADIPLPQIAVMPTLALAALFVIAAIGEELGWSGYAIEPMQSRLGALPASLLLGALWAVWHFIPLIEVGRSIEWIAWWSLGTVAARLIMVWLYNHVGQSVFAMVLYHASSNLS
jgi:membrane protease YdiL (CAAX protease family)